MKKTYILFSLLSPLLLQAQEKKFENSLSNYTGRYLGQKPPGEIPQKFAPGFISKEDENEIGLVFSNDGKQLVYIWALKDWQQFGIRYAKRIGNNWTNPELLLYNGHANVPFNPTFDNEGKNIILTQIAGAWPDTDLFTLGLTSTGYAQHPQRMNTPVNSPGTDFGYFMDQDGTIYFTGKREDFAGGIFDVYSCKKEKGKYITRNIKILNSELDDSAPVVSPDGSYLVYEQMVNDRGLPYNDSTARIIRIELFVSFKDKNGNWSTPVNLGAPVNSNIYRTYRPVISPDGKYLFYTRESERGSDIWWISTNVIERKSNVRREK